MRSNSIKTHKIHDGNVHHKIGGYFIDFVTAIILFVVVVATRDPWLVSRIALFYIGAKLANYGLSPDLDLGRSVPKRKWGALGIIWLPYSTLIKHRSVWSHGINVPKAWRRSRLKVSIVKWFGFLIGTTIRCTYVAVLVIFVCILLNWVVGTAHFTGLLMYALLSDVVLWVVLGVALSDLIHTRYDMITSKK